MYLETLFTGDKSYMESLALHFPCSQEAYKFSRKENLNLVLRFAVMIVSSKLFSEVCMTNLKELAPSALLL